MSTLFSSILQSVKDTFPSISWKLGSVVRELIVSPVEHIASMLEQKESELESIHDLVNILANPIDNEDALDVWINRLGISFTDFRDSAGSVILVTKDNTELNIPNGTEFTWSDYVTVSVVGDHIFTETGPERFNSLSPGVWYVEVPVEIASTASISLSSDAPLNWYSAPDTVTDIYVGKPIVGGQTEVTPQLKAALIEARLTDPGFCGAPAIRAGLSRVFGDRVVDVMMGGRDLTSSKPTVSLYIKQLEPPQTMRIIPTVTYTAEGQPVLTIPAPGMLRVIKVLVGMVTAPHTQTINNGEYLLTLPKEFASAGEVTGYTVICEQLTETPKILAWLNSEQQGAPCVYTGYAPAVAQVKLQINTNGSELDFNTIARICDYINRTKLDGVVSDSAISKILESGGYALHSPVLYTGFIHGNAGTLPFKQLGSLTLRYQTSDKPAPVALYCTSDAITTY